MNCTQCRSHFSEYLEKAVTPVLYREIRAHLDECEGCAGDLHELEVTVARLRGMAAAQAPAGLAASVTARLLASPPIVAGPEQAPDAAPGASPRRGERRLQESERALPWPTLVAASLMIAAASFFCGYLVSRPSASTVAALEDSRERARSLESQLSDTRARLAEENAALKDELTSLRSGLDEWRIEHAAAFERERETRRDLDLRLQEATRRIETQAETLVTLRARLDTAVEERDAAIATKNALSRELRTARTARTELAGARRAASEARARRAIVSESAQARWREYREMPPVQVVREGDVLRLKTRGPLDEIGPPLFALAESDAEPEMADLALATLETRLAPYAPEDDAASSVRDPSVGDRFVGWLSRNVGVVNAAPEQPTGSAAGRAARLDRLRRIWAERFGGPGSE